PLSLPLVPDVGLFVTCVADQVCPDTASATVRVLEAAGARVDFPAAQTCCGQPAFTAGQPDAAAKLARHHLDVFSGYDAVVAPSALLTRAGATLVEMTEADTCCGFGGVFSLDYPEVATRLADAKLGHARETRAAWLASTDLACLLHLDARRRRTGAGPQPV